MIEVDIEELKRWATDRLDYEDTEIGKTHSAYGGHYFSGVLAIIAKLEAAQKDDGDSIADHLQGILRSGSKCPLCARTDIHTHSPEEIIIYRNGVKYGRRISNQPQDAAWCPSLENWWAVASDTEKKRVYAESIVADHWKAKRIRELEDALADFDKEFERKHDGH